MFSVWGSPMLCGGCHLRLANLGSSRSAVRWGTCASPTSLGLHNSASDCLRLARIHSSFSINGTFYESIANNNDFEAASMYCTDQFGSINNRGYLIEILNQQQQEMLVNLSSTDNTYIHR